LTRSAHDRTVKLQAGALPGGRGDMRPAQIITDKYHKN